MVLSQLKPEQYFSFTPAGMIYKALDVQSKFVKYCNHTLKERTCLDRHSDYKLKIFLRNPCF